ncbi:hypothetical protein [Azospirillum doebereinerae]|uniref:Uncharacterized protein n=1 Tax=Azospirillum doebereinerae TaxID=92933 RepID=A0A433J1D8_9PROT|nr:hypothetical protein [Azospirillum doebereinerae]RUQ64007.1 hypothetical protein EJ913_27175 [Azospirillum doebereinerae]
MSPRRIARQPDPIAALPFVATRPARGSQPFPRDFWAVDVASDSYLQECERGEAFAQLALDHMRRQDAAPLLAWIVNDMLDKGRFGGVEIGFLRVFAAAAMRGMPQ